MLIFLNERISTFISAASGASQPFEVGLACYITQEVFMYLYIYIPSSDILNNLIIE
jgi:hypothetical protein